MADQGAKADILWTSDLMLGLLGPVRLISSAGDDMTPKARKTRALLALVALSRTPVSRSRLSDLLWGDRGEDQAKASLRQALYELRALAAAGYVVADRETIGAGGKRLPTDFGLVQSLIDDSKASELADALDDVENPPLGGLDDVTPELDEWLRDERARICTFLVNGALGVAERCLQQGDIALARRIADQLERLDPLDERIAQLGIVADIAGGDRAAAMRRHGRLSGRLDQELGIRPAAETQALLDQAKAAPTAPPPSLARPDGEAAPRRRFLPLLIIVGLLAAAAVLFAFMRSTPVAATPTVAVLPFDDLGQKNEDYFASGVSDEILNLLGHESQIRVLGRASAAQLGSPEQSLDRARNLGVTYLLDGSVQTANDRVVVIARLTRVSDGTQVWSERYEGKAGDIFAVQGNIADAVARRVAQAFGGIELQETSPEVYDRYLAARQLIRERREPALKEAERLLRSAIATDPRYAPAYAELAELIMLESDNPTSYGSIPFAQARAMAEPFARKAIALDPNLGDAYAALGFISLNLDGSVEPYLRKAVELSPQRPEFHRWHGQTLAALGRYDDAVVEFRRAVEIDPLWGLNYEHLIGALYSVGRQDEARRYVQRFFQLSADQRAKLLLLQSLQKLDHNLAAQLKTTTELERAYPDERQMRLNLASTLSELGENHAAARLVGYDHLGVAVLSSNWPAMVQTVLASGPEYWDQYDYWNQAALLIDSGHADTLVKLYDQAQPIIASGRLSSDSVAQPEAVVALRQVGRDADADAVLAQLRRKAARMPNVGLLGNERRFTLAIIAALAGDRETALRALDQWSRTNPLRLLPIPAMALRHDPVFGQFASDPRFPVIEDRIRLAVNAERAKAGLAPLSRETWIGDPQTLLTKN